MSDRTFLIVEDQRLVRQAMTKLIEALGLRCVAELEDGCAAVEVARQQRPDVALIDLGLPGIGGATVARQIREKVPDVRSVALTACADPDALRDFLEAGGMGVIAKGTHIEDLRRVLGSVLAGQPAVALDPQVSALLEPLIARCTRALTERERRVLDLIAHGWTNEEICADLHIGAGALYQTRSRLRHKLGAANDVQLAIHAWRALGVAVPGKGPGGGMGGQL